MKDIAQVVLILGLFLLGYHYDKYWSYLFGVWAFVNYVLDAH